MSDDDKIVKSVSLPGGLKLNGVPRPSKQEPGHYLKVKPSELPNLFPNETYWLPDALHLITLARNWEEWDRQNQQLCWVSLYN